MAFFVKTYGELNAEALRTGRDRELVVWYLLRYLDKPGSGRVRLERLAAFVKSKRLWSQTNLERRLARGEGHFWTVHTTWHGQTIRYKSLQALCETFGVIPCADPMPMPLSALGRLGRCRAHLYAAWITGRQLGRAKITEITGAPAGSQRRYEKLAGVTVEKNISVRAYQEGDQLAPGRWVARSRTGQLLYNVRMVNRYTTQLEAFARGQLRKVRRNLRGLEKAGPIGRLYFQSTWQASKSKTRGAPYYIARHRTWHGAHLWDAVAV